MSWMQDLDDFSGGGEGGFNFNNPFAGWGAGYGNLNLVNKAKFWLTVAQAMYLANRGVQVLWHTGKNMYYTYTNPSTYKKNYNWKKQKFYQQIQEPNINDPNMTMGS